MRNQVRRVEDGGSSIPSVLADMRQALGQPAVGPLRCVGVMIQYGKTITNPRSYVNTTGGGHVSVFVADQYGLQGWDEITDDHWQKTIENSANGMGGDPTNIFRKSSVNDVTIYLHSATDRQIRKVADRANNYVNNYGGTNPKSLTYNHIPSIGKPVQNGDCVTRSAWVMAAFSYSSPFRGLLTPWGMAALYEIYTSPANFLSKWVKIKYKGAKLPVM